MKTEKSWISWQLLPFWPIRLLFQWSKFDVYAFNALLQIENSRLRLWRKKSASSFGNMWVSLFWAIRCKEQNPSFRYSPTIWKLSTDTWTEEFLLLVLQENDFWAKKINSTSDFYWTKWVTQKDVPAEGVFVFLRRSELRNVVVRCLVSSFRFIVPNLFFSNRFPHILYNRIFYCKV